MYTGMVCNGVMVPPGISRNDYVSGYRRSLCLAPSFSCSWQAYDDTTTELVCSLPDKSIVPVHHPDAPLTASHMFYIRYVSHVLHQVRDSVI